MVPKKNLQTFPKKKIKQLQREKERKELEAQQPLNVLANKLGTNINGILEKANNLKNGVNSTLDSIKSRWFSF